MKMSFTDDGTFVIKFSSEEHNLALQMLGHVTFTPETRDLAMAICKRLAGDSEKPKPKKPDLRLV